MKAIVERLSARGVLCKKLSPVPLKTLRSRKKIDCYLGVNLDGFYCSVWVLNKQSRILQKEARELIALHEKLEQHADSRIPKTYLHLDAPVCSKAMAVWEEAGWEIV
jgi:hypothetical protein